MLEQLPPSVMRLVLAHLPVDEVVYGSIRHVSQYLVQYYLEYMATLTELVVCPELWIQGAKATGRLQSLIIETGAGSEVDFVLRIVLQRNASRLKRIGFHSKSVSLAMVQLLRESCPMIRSLTMSDCNLTNRHLELLAGFRYLQNLDLSGNHRLTDLGIAYLSQGCGQLQVLNLSGNQQITDRALELLTDHCPLHRSPRSATQRAFERLQALDLSKTSISNNGIELVRERCPHIEVLTINDCYQVNLYSTVQQSLLMNSAFWPLAT